MDVNYSHIVFILDRSGSMALQMEDAVGGFNAFIKHQKQLPGKCTFSLILFDNQYEQLYDFAPIDTVADLNDQTYYPRGSTALLDAIGRAMTETGIRLAAMPESTRPGRVQIAVLTDGEENSSKEFSGKRIKDMIEHQQTKYSWQITYLSSDINASEQALSYGFSVGNTRSATSIASAMRGYDLSIERSRGISHDVYITSVACALEAANIDNVLNDSVTESTTNIVDSNANTTMESEKTP
jgi:Mg-chelatase subunit ChlD